MNPSKSEGTKMLNCRCDSDDAKLQRTGQSRGIFALALGNLGISDRSG